MNKKVFFLLPFVFSTAVSIVAVLFFSSFLKIESSFEKNQMFIANAYTTIKELDVVDDYLSSVPDNPEYRELWKNSLIKTVISVKTNIDIIKAESDEQIAKRLNHFLSRVLSNTDIFFNEENSDEIKSSALVKMKNESWKLKEIVEHAVKKKLNSQKIEKNKAEDLQKRILLSFVSVFLLSMLIVTVTGIFVQNKLIKITKLLGSDYKASTRDISEAVEKIKSSSIEELNDIKKKYFREQVVSKRKSALLDTIPAGIFSSDTSGRLTYINRKMSEWFNVSSDLIGENSEKVFSLLALEGKEPRKFVFEENIFGLSAYQNGSEIFYIVRNVTDQEELSRKLLDSERLVSIGEMASRITHEIRNPLSTIKLNSEYLAENVEELESSQISTSINLIVKEVERLELITGKYMNMVRYRHSEEGEKNTSLPVDLVEFISFHSSEFEKRNIEIKIESCENFEISMTLSSFKEVMLNLFKNAWEELVEGGKVYVNAYVVDLKAFIAVEDSGGGIPEKEREEIFKNFYTKKPGGTGIGLSHSRKLSLEAGGALYARDSILGGICMVLELPVKKKAL